VVVTDGGTKRRIGDGWEGMTHAMGYVCVCVWEWNGVSGCCFRYKRTKVELQDVCILFFFWQDSLYRTKNSKTRSWAIYFCSIFFSAFFPAFSLYHNHAASAMKDPNPLAMIILPLKPCFLFSASSPPRMTTAFFDQVYSSPL
jgi:hypothetical protein